MDEAAKVIIDAATETDLPAILDILNQAVRETTASWNYGEVNLIDRRTWLADKQAKGFPVLVARRGSQLLGYATYGPFRAFDGYRLTIENSVYVRADLHRRGVGRRLLQALVARAKAQKLHLMVAAIEAENLPSIALHAAVGFRETGRLPQAGAKFGRWLDLVLMQLALDNAEQPPD